MKMKILDKIKKWWDEMNEIDEISRYEFDKKCSEIMVQIVEIQNRKVDEDYVQLIKNMDEMKVCIRKGQSSWIYYSPYHGAYVHQRSWIDKSNPKHELKDSIQVLFEDSFLFSVKELVALEKQRRR